jgi:nucleotide-binding universal stress UspA family protein
MTSDGVTDHHARPALRTAVVAACEDAGLGSSGASNRVHCVVERCRMTSSEASNGPIIACVDGAPLALRAVQAGLALLGRVPHVVVVTVLDDVDGLMDATGHAGSVVSPETFEKIEQERTAAANAIVEEAAATIDAERVETRVLHGPPAASICRFAEDVSARAIVMGTRGRGGIKRAVLGSVSDHVVRNAPCPVITSNPDE